MQISKISTPLSNLARFQAQRLATMSRRSSRLAAAGASQPPAPETTKPASKPKSRSSESTSKTIKPSPVSSSSAKASPAPPTKTAPSASSDIQTLPFPDAPAFRQYMLDVGTSAPGVWLKIAKKSTMIPTVTYQEGIDEALCCGWIDGQRKPLDAQYFLQRFTPRRRKSLWSQRNVGKVAELTAAGRMMPAGVAEVDAAKADGRWEKAYAGSATIEVPADFRAALDAEPDAARTFDALTKSARYPFLYRLCTVKKEETRTRKMAEFVELLARGEVPR